MVNYIILGPPGSGKGTQAKKLAEKLGAFYFGAGDLMREEAKKGTEFGEIFQEVWDQGQGGLVPPQTVKDFVESKLRGMDLKKQIIFDGFPRTLEQAEILDKYFKIENLFVINIDVSKKSLIQRATTRRVCEKCGKIFFRADFNGINQCDVCGGNLVQRQEDTEEIVEKRIEVYEQETKPLIGYYKEKNILVNIDGEPPIDAVEKKIWEKVNE